MNNKRLLSNLKKIQNDPSYINNLTEEELNEVYFVLLPTNNQVSNSSNTNQKERKFVKTNQYYSGEENRTNNNFILNEKKSNQRKIDGFGVLIAFSIVVLICSIVFMLYIINN